MITAKGTIFGKMWGGGYGTYPTKTVRFQNEDAFNLAMKSLNGDYSSLDAGMGFESVEGIILFLTETKVEDDGWTCTRQLDEYDDFGDMTPNQIDLLTERYS